MSKLLVVIDAQNDFINGALGTKEAQAAIPKIQELVREAVNLNLDLVYTLDTHVNATYPKTQEGRNLPVLHCDFNSDGWALHKNVECPSHYPAHFLIKFSFGTTKWINELDLLKYDEIVVCGFVTSICVMSNICVIKAFEPEAKITLVADATADTSPEMLEHSLAVLRNLQVNVVEHYKFVI